MYTGLDDNRSGIGPVSSADGRQLPACVGKIYLQSVDGGRYSRSTDGFVIATVYQARRRRDSEDRAMGPVTENSPASPVSAKDGYQETTNSPCMILDDISSCSSVGDTSPHDFKVTLLYDSGDSITPVGSIVFSSDEDVPLSSGQEDRRKVRKRDPRPMNQPGPTEVPEYELLPRERPGDVPVYETTPRERPIDDPKLRGRSVDDKAYEPMPWKKPVADPTLRERAVDEPMPRNRPDDVRAYEPTPRERPVDDPKLRGRSVDDKAYEPMPRKKPVDDPTLRERQVDEQMSINRLDDVPPYEPTPRERPVDDPTHKGRPVDDPVYELMTIERPVDVLVYEPTPRERPVDAPELRERSVDDQAYEQMPKGRPVKPKTVPVWCEPPPPADLPEWSESEVMPLIIIENSSVVDKPKTTDGLLPIGSDILLPQSPEVTSFEDQGSMSAPLSPNRVRKGHSQDMPAEGSLFEVSPDVPGFHMRPAGGGVQTTEITQPSPSKFVGFNNPFFGAPIAFAQCQNTSGMDTTTTVPIYNIPKDSNIGIDQSAVPTVFASGVSPDSIPWSTAEDIIRDIVREGPFDAGATPMETEDSPLISTSMPGCPYRMTSYAGTSMVDADTRYGLQLHHPRFLEFIGAPESARLLNHSPSFWVDRLGQESAMAAAVNLQRDAGFMMSNLQILAQFVMSLHRMSAEMLSIGVDHVVFPLNEVDKLSVMPRAQRAAKYMSAMGLWRPPSGRVEVDLPFLYELQVLLWQKRAVGSVTILTFLIM